MVLALILASAASLWISRGSCELPQTREQIIEHVRQMLTTEPKRFRLKAAPHDFKIDDLPGRVEKDPAERGARFIRAIVETENGKRTYYVLTAGCVGGEIWEDPPLPDWAK
jgi:hypothetical protein